MSAVVFSKEEELCIDIYAVFHVETFLRCHISSVPFQIVKELILKSSILPPNSLLHMIQKRNSMLKYQSQT